MGQRPSQDSHCSVLYSENSSVRESFSDACISVPASKQDGRCRVHAKLQRTTVTWLTLNEAGEAKKCSHGQSAHSRILRQSPSLSRGCRRVNKEVVRGLLFNPENERMPHILGVSTTSPATWLYAGRVCRAFLLAVSWDAQGAPCPPSPPVSAWLHLMVAVKDPPAAWVSEPSTTRRVKGCRPTPFALHADFPEQEGIHCDETQ